MVRHYTDLVSLSILPTQDAHTTILSRTASFWLLCSKWGSVCVWRALQNSFPPNLSGAAPQNLTIPEQINLLFSKPGKSTRPCRARPPELVLWHAEILVSPCMCCLRVLSKYLSACRHGGGGNGQAEVGTKPTSTSTTYSVTREQLAILLTCLLLLLVVACLSLLSTEAREPLLKTPCNISFCAEA